MRGGATSKAAKAVAPLALLLALAACGGHETVVPAPKTISGGERFVVREQVVSDLKPVAAIVTTRNEGDARARIGGVIARLPVREGQTVREGQEIARIVDRRLDLETTGYAAQVSAAAAESERARAELARVQSLYKSGYFAKARLEQAEAAARGADGNLAAARAQHAASAEVSAQGIVRAPSAGRVLRADVPAGSVVTPGQTIAVITSGEPLIRLEIPEAQARSLRVGQSVALASEDLLGGPAEGVVVQVYPAVAAGRVVADIRAGGLRGDLVGQRVRVRVAVGERQAILIPRRFVATRFGVDFVRLVETGGRVSDVAVQLAPSADPEMVEVLSGVRSGDTLVAPGAER